MKNLVSLANQSDNFKLFRLSSKLDKILLNIANNKALTPQQKWILSLLHKMNYKINKNKPLAPITPSPLVEGPVDSPAQIQEKTKPMYNNNTTTSNGQVSNFNLYNPPEVKINIIE